MPIALRWTSVNGRSYRQSDPESGAFTYNAFDADLAAMLLDDRFADVQPQTQAAVLATPHADATDAVKPMPDTFLLAGRQAGPVVPHDDPRDSALEVHPHADRLIFGGVLQGVRQIIHDHLANAVSISQHAHRHTIPDLDVKCALGVRLAHDSHLAAHESRQIVWLAVELE